MRVSPCPACGSHPVKLTVTGVDHGAGVVTLASEVDSTKFYTGQRITFSAGRSRWQRFKDVIQAARMAWSR